MTPIQIFKDVWLRGDILGNIHNYLSHNGTSALRPEEILRAEWAARVSAFDLYVHELASQRLTRIFNGTLPSTPAFSKFRISADALLRIRSAVESQEAQAAFDLDVREQFSALTFQMPDKVANAIRLCSKVELWNAVAIHQGACDSEVKQRAKSIKQSLSLIVTRRNKIAHEGDLQPGVPRVPWPITEADLTEVREFIERLVTSIDEVVTAEDPATGN